MRSSLRSRSSPTTQLRAKTDEFRARIQERLSAHRQTNRTPIPDRQKQIEDERNKARR